MKFFAVIWSALVNSVPSSPFKPKIPPLANRLSTLAVITGLVSPPRM